MPAPIYTPDNCREAAFQLDWSYSVFWRERPQEFTWLDEVQKRSEHDGIRILQHRFQEPNVSQFLISTRPPTAPLLIVQRVKGRLQHLVHGRIAKPFRRNYSLRSIGSTRRDKLQQYLATQLRHHPMADPRVQERPARYQTFRRETDLSQPRSTSHALYWYNQHIVLVRDERPREIREEMLGRQQDMICRAADGKGHLLSRAAIVADHIHLTLGGNLEESPEQVSARAWHGSAESSSHRASSVEMGFAAVGCIVQNRSSGGLLCGAAVPSAAGVIRGRPLRSMRRSRSRH